MGHISETKHDSFFLYLGVELNVNGDIFLPHLSFDLDSVALNLQVLSGPYLCTLYIVDFSSLGNTIVY